MREAFRDQLVDRFRIGAVLERARAARHHLGQLRAEPRAVLRAVGPASDFQRLEVRGARAVAVVARAVVVAQLDQGAESFFVSGGNGDGLLVELDRPRDGKAPARLDTRSNEMREGLLPDRFALGLAPGQVGVLAGRGRRVVEGEQLTELVCAAARELFDPSGDLCMGSCAPDLGQGRVGDVPDQGVLEGVLGVIGKTRSRRRGDQTAPFKRQQSRWDLVTQRSLERVGPEQPADDRGLLEHALVEVGQGIDASRQEREQRVGQRCLGEASGAVPSTVLPDQHLFLDQAAHDLLEEEGVTVGFSEDVGGHLGWHVGHREQALEQLLALLG